MTWIHASFAIIVLLCLLAAAWDLRTGLIPNWLVLTGFALAFPLQAAVHVALGSAPNQSAPEALLGALGSLAGGAVVCALAPLLLWRFNAMGGGDVKLLTAVGALAGPMIGIEIELYAFVLLALYACARMAYDGHLIRMIGSSLALAVNPFLPPARRRSVPQALLTSLRFGPAVLAASALVLGLRLFT